MRTFAIAIAAFAATALSAYAGTNGEVRVRFPIGDGGMSVTEVIERDGRVSSAVTNVTSGLPKNEFGVVYCDEFVANAIISARVRKVKSASALKSSPCPCCSQEVVDEGTRKRQEAWERMQRTFENNKRRREKMRKDKEEGGVK